MTTKRITAKAFYAHINADELEFIAGRKRDEEAKKERAAIRVGLNDVHERLDKVDRRLGEVTTKKDFEEFKDFMTKWRVGWSLVSVSGSTVVKIGAVVMALIAIFSGWKLLVAYFFIK